MVASRSYPSLEQAREALTAQHAGARVSLNTDPTATATGQPLYWAEVTYPRLVIARVGSRVERLTTFATTPARVAELVGYELRPADQVRVARDSLGQLRQVKVLLVRRGVHVVTRQVPFSTRVVTDESLSPGREVLRSAGRPGAVKLKVRWLSVNGRVQERTRVVLSRRAPLDRVVARGPINQPPAPVTGGYPLVDGGAEAQNWPALAQCESSGNPRAVNPAGYYGLYQFNTGTWASVGGKGLPSHASAAEQTYRAKLLFASRGAQPWPHCGRYL